MTQYYKEHYRTLKLLNVGTLLTDGKDRYLLRINDGDVIIIPSYVTRSLLGERQVTQQWGPYIFYNGFETTAAARYVKDMFKYPYLTDRARFKVATILTDSSEWIEENKEFMEVLSEREAAFIKHRINSNHT